MSSAPRFVLANELTTTPNDADDDLIFTVTHPFHPLSGHQFALLAQRWTWGEDRVFFLDPTTDQVRSLPVAWTNRVALDPFLDRAAGRAILHAADLPALVQLLDDLRERLQEVP